MSRGAYETLLRQIQKPGTHYRYLGNAEVLTTSWKMIRIEVFRFINKDSTLQVAVFWPEGGGFSHLIHNVDAAQLPRDPRLRHALDLFRMEVFERGLNGLSL